MHAGLQSAGAGAGPPRAVAKLGLLNCYYRGGPIRAEPRSCQHSRPRPRLAAGSHWPPPGPGPAPAARAPAPICCAGRRSPLCVNLRAARRRGGGRALGESAGVWGSGAAGRAGRAASGAGRAAAAAVPKRARGGRAGGRMELNSLLILLEAAEYLERRDRGRAPRPFVRPDRGRAGGAGTRGPLTAPSVRRGRARLRVGAALRRRLRQEENKGGRPGAQGPEQQVPPPARARGVPLLGPGRGALRPPPALERAPYPGPDPSSRGPVARLEEEAPGPPQPRPAGRARPVAIFPAGRASSASRVNSATRTAPVAQGLLPGRLSSPGLFWTLPRGKKVVRGAGRCPLGLGKLRFGAEAAWGRWS